LAGSTALMALKEENFPRNKEFLPERWLRDVPTSAECPSARNANPFVYLPFGFGARMCVGKRFADLELEIIIARMVKEFQIEWHHGPIQYKSTFLNVPVGDLKFRMKEIN
jgi:cytochrome P450 family 12